MILERRSIDELVIVAGPSCAGKTHLLDRFRAGDLEALEALGIADQRGWETINLGRIRERPETHFERVALHVDTMRTRFGEARTPASWHVEDLIGSAGSVRVVTLLCDARTLCAQLECRERDNLDFPASRVTRLRQYYSSDDLVDEHYQMWADYCATRRLETKVVPQAALRV